MLGFVFTEDINLELFISMIWAVWNRRKNLRLLKPVVPLNQLLQLAKERLQERDSLSLSMSPLRSRPQQSQAAWIPPSTSCFKIKFDGATFKKEGSAGLSVII